MADNIRLCINRRQDASLETTQVFKQSQTGSCQSYYSVNIVNIM